MNIKNFITKFLGLNRFRYVDLTKINSFRRLGIKPFFFIKHGDPLLLIDGDNRVSIAFFRIEGGEYLGSGGGEQ